MNSRSTPKPASSKNGSSPNGAARLPKASDFKLPKKLSKADRERIEMTKKLFDAIHNDYKKAQEHNA